MWAHKYNHHLQWSLISPNKQCQDLPDMFDIPDIYVKIEIKINNNFFLYHVSASTYILCICISETFIIFPLYDDLLMYVSSNTLYILVGGCLLGQ